MTAVVRQWIALAALGAGLVHLGVAAGAPPVLLALFGLLSVAEIAWCVAVLRADRFPLRSVALAGALLGPLIWAASLFAGPALSVDAANLPPAALAGATLLDVIVAAAVALSLRRHPRVQPIASEPHAGLLLAGLALGAVAVTGVALPALGSTSAGIAASDGPHSHSRVSDLPGELPGHTGH
ncbi:MAG: hypothetical protein JWP66_538 [Naasia sp.]|nr:hypothetical protein [Naasia sp.]